MSEKAKHFTAAKNYKALDGNIKSFDFIDHDIKPKISTYMRDDNIKSVVKSDRDDLVKRIMEIPAVFCGDYYQEDFTIRGDGPIEWNKTMIEDEGIPFNKLRDIYTLASRKQSFHKHGITP